jgi:hypothetical protein
MTDFCGPEFADSETGPEIRSGICGYDYAIRIVCGSNLGSSKNSDSNTGSTYIRWGIRIHYIRIQIYFLKQVLDPDSEARIPFCITLNYFF